MEYRKGQSLIVHKPDCKGLFNLTVNETTEAFRLNNVTFAKSILARQNGGKARFEDFMALVCIMWFFVNFAEPNKNAPADHWYLKRKFTRIYDSLGISSSDPEKDTLLTGYICQWMDNQRGDDRFSSSVTYALGRLGEKVIDQISKRRNLN